MKTRISNKISELEFIVLMALLMANVAMSIDGILPGLSSIGKSLQHTNSADLQLIITSIFVGLGVGQLFFGTLSDSLGRKPIVYAGIATFLFSSIIVVNATSIEMMLVGRFLQGIGLSAARSVSISIIRDLYEGDNMARVMSFINVVFILVPMLAPIIGQQILNVYNWQAIIYFQMGFTSIILIWFAFRQEETINASNKTELSKHLFIDGAKEFLKYRQSIVFTLIAGFIMGSFMVFLSSSKQIFQDQYGFVNQFAFIFAAISFFLGLSTFLNGSLVLKYGMEKLITYALLGFTLNALIYTILYFSSENPNIYILVVFLALQFLFLGFVFGNVNALSMQPIGHIAGIGASINGFISTILAVPIAIIIGKYINKTALPLFIGFLICGIISILLLLLFKSNRAQKNLALDK